MPQTWGTAEQAGPGGKRAPLAHSFPRSNEGKSVPFCCPPLLIQQDWGVENLLHATGLAKGKGQQPFTVDRVQSYTGTTTISATQLRGGCWSLCPHPPHHPLHKARVTIMLFSPELCP